MEWLFFTALVIFIIVSIAGLAFRKKSKELNKKVENLQEQNYRMSDNRLS